MAQLIELVANMKLFHGLIHISALLSIAVGSLPEARADVTTLNLGGAWQVARTGDHEWFPAKVPGCIHTDLLAAGKIPDPFFRDNENAVQWIGETNWTYRRTFEVLSLIHI